MGYSNSGEDEDYDTCEDQDEIKCCPTSGESHDDSGNEANECC